MPYLSPGVVTPIPEPAPPTAQPVNGCHLVVGWRTEGAARRMWPVGLLDRLRGADAGGRLGGAGLTLAGLVVAMVAEDAHLWPDGWVPVRYGRLAAESGYSRSTVVRRLPEVLWLLADMGAVEYSRRVGEPYRVRLLVGADDLTAMGVAWVPWAVADASHRMHPRDWSHTDRAVARAWWSFARWDGQINGRVDGGGLAARAGLRPSTIRAADPAGLWAVRGRRLRVGGWTDPALAGHRRSARYGDYRCSMPSRSGLEGASLRWHGPVAEPSPVEDTELWGQLIYFPPYVLYTAPTQRSSGARPVGSGPRKQERRGPPRSPRVRKRWTPDRAAYERAVADESWRGPAGKDVAMLARRYGWQIAEQAALAAHWAVTSGRPVRSATALAAHYARCCARPETCWRRHGGPCGQLRLDLLRGVRLDEEQQARAAAAADHTQASASASAGPAGGQEAVPGDVDDPGWAPDPVTSLTEAAEGGGPRLLGLAQRVGSRQAAA